MNLNGPSIILARANVQMGACVACRQPVPLEMLGGGILCQGCWVGIGGHAGWMLEPGVAGLNVSIRLLLLSELLSHQGAHGHAEDPLMCLRRLLHERLRLLQALAQQVPEPTCCYCGHEPVAKEDGELLPNVEGLIPVIRCVDRAACGGRVTAQVRARLATAGQQPA